LLPAKSHPSGTRRHRNADAEYSTGKPAGARKGYHANLGCLRIATDHPKEALYAPRQETLGHLFEASVAARSLNAPRSQAA